MNRRTLDAADSAYPTIIRYLGLALAVAYFVGRALGVELPDSSLIAATGMTLYKNIVHAGSNNGKES